MYFIPMIIGCTHLYVHWPLYDMLMINYSYQSADVQIRYLRKQSRQGSVLDVEKFWMSWPWFTAEKYNGDEEM